jgi:uncharacterized lipoprotein YmbA
MNRFRSATALALLACCILLVPVTARADGKPTADAADAFAAKQIAQQLLNQLGEGLASYNSRKLLAAFDRDSMPGYLAFQDQVESFFAQYESFRVSIRLMESSFEQDKGMATAEFRLEGIPRDGSPAMRREAELMFEFVRTPSGWKLRDVTPRSFFS